MKKYKVIISEKGFVVKSKKSLTEPFKKKFVEAKSEWDAAHKYLEDNKAKSDLINYVEPEIESKLFAEEIETGLKVKSGPDGYLKNWPKPNPGKDAFVWHLGIDYSQLAAARDKVWAKIGVDKCIKIAHIDTGYEKGHPSLPEFMQAGVSFIDGELGKPAVDNKRKSLAEQQGHGTATMSILAGKEVTMEITENRYSGKFGAIPFAEIIPIRICDTVALIRSNSFVRAVDYAIGQGCEVITMSMAGAPTQEWANVVNKAYEAGVFMVTAAGNSWVKGAQSLLPKRLLYPARWERVVAATGITAEHLPYVFKAPKFISKTAGGETMQGNYGPQKSMSHAIAAYTPNISWATMGESNKKKYFSLDGGGTSSATPQVAAAAALWICYNRDKLKTLIGSDVKDQWKKVEAVRYALFESAGKEYPEYDKYLGQGVVKAFDALKKFPGEKDLQKSQEAKVGMDGILDLLGILLRVKSQAQISKYDIIKNKMHVTELAQLLHSDPSLNFLLDYDDDQKWKSVDKKKAKELLVKSKNISRSLKKKIKTI